MPDTFSTHSSGLDSPARHAYAITPDDNNDLATVTRAIYSGNGGDVVCILCDSTTEVTLKSMGPGMILPLRVKRVKSTGTTSNISLVGLV